MIGRGFCPYCGRAARRRRCACGYELHDAEGWPNAQDLLQGKAPSGAWDAVDFRVIAERIHNALGGTEAEVWTGNDMPGLTFVDATRGAVCQLPLRELRERLKAYHVYMLRDELGDVYGMLLPPSLEYMRQVHEVLVSDARFMEAPVQMEGL